MKSHVYDLNIRVLVYKEDEEFVAHALELDLLGYGKDMPSAQEALKKSINEQLLFCSHISQPSMPIFPAPKEFFDRWEKAQRASIKGLFEDCDLRARWKAQAKFYTLEASDLKRLEEQAKKMTSTGKKRAYEPVLCG